MPKKTAYIEEELIAQIRSKIPVVLENIRDGNFQCFDAILGDGGCQLRAFYITHLHTSGILESLHDNQRDLESFVSSILNNTPYTENAHLYNLCLLHIFTDLSERKYAYNVIVSSKLEKLFPLQNKEASKNLKQALANSLKAFLINFSATYFQDLHTESDLSAEKGEFKFKKNKASYTILGLKETVQAITVSSENLIVVVDMFITNKGSYEYLKTQAYSVANDKTITELDPNDPSPRTVVRGYSLSLDICAEHLYVYYPDLIEDAELQSTKEEELKFYAVREESKAPSLQKNAQSFVTYHCYSSSPKEICRGIQEVSSMPKNPFNDSVLYLPLASQHGDICQLPIYEQLTDEFITGTGATLVDLAHNEYPEASSLPTIGFAQIPNHGTNIFIGHYNNHYVVLLQIEGNIHILDPLGTDLTGVADIAIDGFYVNYYHLWLTRAYRS